MNKNQCLLLIKKSRSLRIKTMDKTIDNGQLTIDNYFLPNAKPNCQLLIVHSFVIS